MCSAGKDYLAASWFEVQLIECMRGSVWRRSRGRLPTGVGGQDEEKHPDQKSLAHDGFDFMRIAGVMFSPALLFGGFCLRAGCNTQLFWVAGIFVVTFL